VGATEVTADGDAESCARGSTRLLGELQGDAFVGNGVVLADGAGVLMAEDLVEVGAGDGDEGGGRVGGAMANSSL
jgi:hypothetical protein